MAIVVDSTTPLRKDFSSPIDVYTVPNRIFIEDEEVEDVPETKERVLEALYTGKKVQTSLPRPDLVESTFEQLHKLYDHVYVLSVSSKLSGNYSLFTIVASKYDNFTVLDSKTGNVQNTYILERMVKDISKGVRVSESDVLRYKENSILLAVIVEIDRLNRTGKMIGKIATLLGKLIGVKLLIEISVQGDFKLITATTSLKRLIQATDRTISKFIERVRKKYSGPLCLYAGLGKKDYEEQIREFARKYELTVRFVEPGPSALAHVGAAGYGFLVGVQP
ncbi:DegV family protein [Pseudothermotoga sp.]